MIDVETTGLFSFRQDWVVELAAVVIRANGGIECEFISLVNPVRDIGQSGITYKDGLSEANLSLPHSLGTLCFTQLTLSNICSKNIQEQKINE